MGGRGRRLIIAPLEVKCPRAKALGSPRAFYLFGGAIINLRPRSPMYYSLNRTRLAALAGSKYNDSPFDIIIKLILSLTLCTRINYYSVLPRL